MAEKPKTLAIRARFQPPIGPFAEGCITGTDGWEWAANESGEVIGVAFLARGKVGNDRHPQSQSGVAPHGYLSNQCQPHMAKLRSFVYIFQ